MDLRHQLILGSSKMFELPSPKSENIEVDVGFPLVANKHAMKVFLGKNSAEGHAFRSGVDGLFDQLIIKIKEFWTTEQDEKLKDELATIANNIKNRFHISGNDEENNAKMYMLYTEGVRGLKGISDLVGKDDVALDAKKNALKTLIRSCGVCSTGVFINILTCYKELIQDHAEKLMQIREQLTKEHILSVFRSDPYVKKIMKNDQFKKVFQGREIHHVQSILNYHAKEFGLNPKEDEYADDLSRPYITPALLDNHLYVYFQNLHTHLQGIAVNINKDDVVNGYALVNYLLLNEDGAIAALQTDLKEKTYVEATSTFQKQFDKYGSDDADLFSMGSIVHFDDEVNAYVLHKAVVYNASIKISLLERLKISGYINENNFHTIKLNKQDTLVSYSDDLRMAYILTQSGSSKTRAPFYLHYVEALNDLSQEENLALLQALPFEVLKLVSWNINRHSDDELVRYFLNQISVCIWQLYLLADHNPFLNGSHLGTFNAEQKEVVLKTLNKEIKFKQAISHRLVTEGSLLASMPVWIVDNCLHGLAKSMRSRLWEEGNDSPMFYYAIKYLKSPAIWQGLLEDVDQNKLKDTLFMHDASGFSGFRLAILHLRDKHTWAVLLDSIDSNQLQKVFFERHEENVANFRIAIAHLHDDSIWKMLLEKLAPGEINKHLMNVDAQGISNFVYVMWYVKSPTKEAILQHLSASELKQALLQVDQEGYSGFQSAVTHLNSLVMWDRIFQILTPTEIKEILSKKNKHGLTDFAYALFKLKDATTLEKLLLALGVDELVNILALRQVDGESNFMNLLDALKDPALWEKLLSRLGVEKLKYLIHMEPGFAPTIYHRLPEISFAINYIRVPLIWEVLSQKLPPYGMYEALSTLIKGKSGFQRAVEKIKDLSIWRTILKGLSGSDLRTIFQVELNAPNGKGMDLINNFYFRIGFSKQFTPLPLGCFILKNGLHTPFRDFVLHPKLSVNKRPKAFLRFLFSALPDDENLRYDVHEWQSIIEKALTCMMDINSRDSLAILSIRSFYADYNLDKGNSSKIIRSHIFSLKDISLCSAKDSLFIAKVLNAHDDKNYLILLHLKNAEKKGSLEAKAILKNLNNGDTLAYQAADRAHAQLSLWFDKLPPKRSSFSLLSGLSQSELGPLMHELVAAKTSKEKTELVKEIVMDEHLSAIMKKNQKLNQWVEEMRLSYQALTPQPEPKRQAWS